MLVSNGLVANALSAAIRDIVERNPFQCRNRLYVLCLSTVSLSRQRCRVITSLTIVLSFPIVACIDHRP